MTFHTFIPPTEDDRESFARQNDIEDGGYSGALLHILTERTRGKEGEVSAEKLKQRNIFKIPEPLALVTRPAKNNSPRTLFSAGGEKRFSIITQRGDLDIQN